MDKAIKKRFWSKVKKTKTCWLWTDSLGRGYGYGALRISGKDIGAHRVSYEIAYGPIRGGLYVCHHCDNKACVRPTHLFLGTNKDNILDMVKKGRHVPCKGSKNGCAKLTEEHVALIRKICTLKKRKQKYVAKIFNVSEAMISDIVTRKFWKHV